MLLEAGFPGDGAEGERAAALILGAVLVVGAAWLVPKVPRHFTRREHRGGFEFAQTLWIARRW